MTVRTIFSTASSLTEDYAFLLPLGCLFIRDAIGHTPIAFLVGRLDEWRAQCPLVVDALQQHEIEFYFIDRIAGQSDATVAQNVRHHAAALPHLAPEQWLTLCDADLWPLHRGFYHRHDDFKGRLAVYYSNGDHFKSKADVLDKHAKGLDYPTLPTCHTVMRVCDWREVYQIEVVDPRVATAKTLERMEPWLQTFKDQKLARWCSDVWHSTMLVCSQPWFPDSVLFVERAGHPPVDRLDRAFCPWPTKLIGRAVDAHVHRGPTVPMHWRDELGVVTHFMPQHIEWAKEYHRRWVAAR